MKITLCQLNFTVGDFKSNTDKIIEFYNQNLDSDLVIFPELCVSGYPPEDMVRSNEFVEKSIFFGNQIIEHTKGKNTDILIAVPWIEEEKKYNACILASDGKILHKQYKYDLPNYGVFDEKRVFDAGEKPEIFEYRGRKIGLLICEDNWNKDLSKCLAGAEYILSVNASPYERVKHDLRLEVISKVIDNVGGCPVFYLNQICGHDDLVFDGGSFVMASNKNIVHQMKFFAEDVASFDVDEVLKAEPYSAVALDKTKHIYRAMMLGLSDYVGKNGFNGVVVGLSGGIDSAITAAIATDALGKDKVRLVYMPSRYNSDESEKDAKQLAQNLGIELEVVSIEPIFEIYMQSLKGIFEDTNKDTAEENLQSRIRGSLLMAISNKFGNLLLSTGNKSETATGYSTLYGDMAGGYNLIKDLYKTRVYEVSNWRNNNVIESFKVQANNIIPQNIIDKAPTAELRPNQKDTDSLPDYSILDPILYNLVEMTKSAEEIVQMGYDEETVRHVEGLLYKSEFKRRQSAIGVKVSSMPFGRDRRYPITNKFVEY